MNGTLRPWGAVVLAVAVALSAPLAQEVRVRPVALLMTHPNGVRLAEPQGLFFDAAAQELYVADTQNHLVAIFAPDGMSKFAFGSESGLREPKRVMADSRGRIYVVGLRSDVQVFSYRGEPLGTFPFDGAPGDGAVRVSAMAVGPGDRLVFADELGRRVLVYDADWGFASTFGHPGEGRGAFAAPAGLAIGPDGEIVVSDRLGIPVQVFSPAGRVLHAWGEHDLARGAFSLPAGVAVDGRGRVYVADTLRQDVKVFDPGGRFLFGFGGYGTNAGQLAYPVDVAVSDDGLVYVCEKVGRRVQIFRLEEGPPAPSPRPPAGSAVGVTTLQSPARAAIGPGAPAGPNRARATDRHPPP